MSRQFPTLFRQFPALLRHFRCFVHVTYKRHIKCVIERHDNSRQFYDNLWSGVAPASQTKERSGHKLSQGHSETKVQCESCLLSWGKTPEFTKKGEIHELFVLALSLVWFAGATPDMTEFFPSPFSRPLLTFADLFQSETFLAGALYRQFREFMRILTTFHGKTPRNPS